MHCHSIDTNLKNVYIIKTFARMDGLLAQQVEQRPFKAWVTGSNPVQLSKGLSATEVLFFIPNLQTKLLYKHKKTTDLHVISIGYIMDYDKKSQTQKGLAFKDDQLYFLITEH